MSPSGHERRIPAVSDESALPSIADVLLLCGEGRSGPTRDIAVSRDEQHFSNVAAILNKVMGFGDLVESKALRNPRLDSALVPQIQ